MTTPYIEDYVVVRRRVRINDEGRVERQLIVWTTTKDDDVALAMLERAKWSIGHGEQIVDGKMSVKVDESGVVDE